MCVLWEVEIMTSKPTIGIPNTHFITEEFDCCLLLQSGDCEQQCDTEPVLLPPQLHVHMRC